MLLSSAGRCHDALVVGTPDPYDAHMGAPGRSRARHGGSRPRDRPGRAPVRMPRDFYQAGDFGFGHGISAAPSMHVASTWMIARMAQCYGLGAAIAGWSFFGIIFVGSIYLGWHYAIDGYISIISIVLRRLAGWWLNRPRVKAFLFSTARA